MTESALHPTRMLLTALALVGAGAPLLAQDVRYELFPADFSFAFGHALHPLGDVDGDGRVDFAVGQRVGYTGLDRVEVVSGASGARLYGLLGPDSLHYYGSTLAHLDDRDGDGVAELVVGSPQAGRIGDIGFVELRSGATGALLDTWHGPVDTNFAETLATIGDVDGDGRRDLLVGASYDFHQGGGPAAAHVLSGADGTTLYSILGGQSDQLGRSLAALPDLDGDGTEDLAVGGWSFVQLHSGATGALLLRLDDPDSRPSFGAAIAPWTDVDGDGLVDLAIGTPVDTNQEGNPIGHVDVHSSATGALLDTLLPNGPFGTFGVALVPVGDVDHDGVVDLAVGQTGSYLFGDGSAVHLYSGAQRRRLFHLAASEDFEELGASFSALGDVDGDGFVELAAGAPGAQRVSVLSYRTLAGEAYCRSNPNSTGAAAEIHALGFDSVASSPLTLLAAPLPARKAGVFFYGASRRELPFGPGFLCIAPGGGSGIRRLPVRFSSADGVLALALDPSTRFLSGETWNFQAFFRDDSPEGFQLSNGVGISFQP